MSSFLTFIALLFLVDLLFSLPYGVIISILCLNVNNRKSGNICCQTFFILIGCCTYYDNLSLIKSYEVHFFEFL